MASTPILPVRDMNTVSGSQAVLQVSIWGPTAWFTVNFCRPGPSSCCYMAQAVLARKSLPSGPLRHASTKHRGIQGNHTNLTNKVACASPVGDFDQRLSDPCVEARDMLQAALGVHKVEIHILSAPFEVGVSQQVGQDEHQHKV